MSWTGCGPLTGAVNEGPLVALVPGAAAGFQTHVLGRDMSLALLALLHQPLHRPAVRALQAQALPRTAGISTPAALRLLQTLGTRPQA